MSSKLVSLLKQRQQKSFQKGTITEIDSTGKIEVELRDGTSLIASYPGNVSDLSVGKVVTVGVVDGGGLILQTLGSALPQKVTILVV